MENALIYEKTYKKTKNYVQTRIYYTLIAMVKTAVYKLQFRVQSNLFKCFARLSEYRRVVLSFGIVGPSLPSLVIV